MQPSGRESTESHEQVAEFSVMSSAVWHGKGVCEDGGLEQGNTIPGIIRKMIRDFSWSTLCGEEQIPHGNGVIPGQETRKMSKGVVQPSFEGLT